MYIFALLDPRPTAEAAAANEKVFENPVGVLGIEVTVLALAARCNLGNIDPQHSGMGHCAAIELVLDHPKPSRGATLVTIRPDLDSIGSMALFSLLGKGVIQYGSLPGSGDEESHTAIYSVEGVGDGDVGEIVVLPEVMERLDRIAWADRSARGVWQPASLPTRENPWPRRHDADPQGDPSILGLAAAVSDYKVALADRVALMERWLLAGDEPAGYRERIEAERMELIDALESGDIKLHEVKIPAFGIAVVESTHRAAMGLGYCLAPVVVALNPSFRFQGGESHRKFTVAQYEPHYVDLKAAVAELAALEPGWGGSPTIVGSPQGVGSTLTTDRVVEVVSRHFKMGRH